MQHIHRLGEPTDLAEQLLADLVGVLQRRGRPRSGALAAGIHSLRFHADGHQEDPEQLIAPAASVELYCDAFLVDAFDHDVRADLVSALGYLSKRRGITIVNVTIRAAVPPPETDTDAP